MNGRSEPRVLTDDEVRAALTRRAPGFTLEEGAVVGRSRHGDFAGSLDFVNRVGALAEGANHHPDVEISWDRVTLRLVTHSAGGITEADLAMAETIGALVEG